MPGLGLHAAWSGARLMLTMDDSPFGPVTQPWGGSRKEALSDDLCDGRPHLAQLRILGMQPAHTSACSGSGLPWRRRGDLRRIHPGAVPLVVPNVAGVVVAQVGAGHEDGDEAQARHNEDASDVMQGDVPPRNGLRVLRAEGRGLLAGR